MAKTCIYIQNIGACILVPGADPGWCTGSMCTPFVQTGQAHISSLKKAFLILQAMKHLKNRKKVAKCPLKLFKGWVHLLELKLRLKLIPKSHQNKPFSIILEVISNI